MPSASKLSHSKFCTRPPAGAQLACSDRSFRQVTGVDACNAERLSDYVDELASLGGPLILDLRGVGSFSDDGLRALVRIVEKSQRIAVRWALVTSQAVGRLLPITDSNYPFPTAVSLRGGLTAADTTQPCTIATASRHATRGHEMLGHADRQVKPCGLNGHQISHHRAQSPRSSYGTTSYAGCIACARR
jgi:anti-anti-sigma regulatory factor